MAEEGGDDVKLGGEAVCGGRVGGGVEGLEEGREGDAEVD